MRKRSATPRNGPKKGKPDEIVVQPDGIEARSTIVTYTHTQYGTVIRWATYLDPAWHMRAEVFGWHLFAHEDGVWEICRDGEVRAHGKEGVCVDAVQRAIEVLHGLTKDLFGEEG